MGKRVKVLLGATLAIAVLGISGAAIAGATGDDDDSEQAITGQALDRASAAALEHTGGGKVTETEAGDEEGAYEIEVTLDDGSQVDVHLDTGFNVINQADDGNEGGEDDNGDKD
jgi:uncharacterized membrane protein YkoI